MHCDSDISRAITNELKALRKVYRRTKIRKTNDRVLVGTTVPAPPVAAHLDVDRVKLLFTISVENLTLDEDASKSERRKPTVTIDVIGDELPATLREAMSKELRKEHEVAVSQKDAFLGLQQVCDKVNNDFLTLICLVPSCIERYEAVDANGSTVRRVAILTDEAPVKSCSSSLAVPVSQRSSNSNSHPEAEPSVVQSSTTAEAEPQAQITATTRGGLQSELQYLMKRYPGCYSAALSDTQHLEAQEKLSSSSDRMDKSQVAIAENDECAVPLLGAAQRHEDKQIGLILRIVPTDPQWKPPGSPITLKCTLNAKTYPSPASLTVSLRPDSTLLLLGERQRQAFDRLVCALIELSGCKPGLLRAVMRHIENHAGALLDQAADVALEVDRRKRVASERARKTTSQLCQGTSENVSGSGEAVQGLGDDDFVGDVDLRPSTDVHYLKGHGAAASREKRIVHDALSMSLEGLELLDIDTLDILSLHLQASCSRCNTFDEISVVPSTGDPGRNRYYEVEGTCRKCQSRWKIEMLPRIVHAHSNELATIRAQGCALADTLPSTLASQCGKCSALAAFRDVHTGQWNERACPHCHATMKFRFQATAFTFKSPGAGVVSSPSARSVEGSGKTNKVTSLQARGEGVQGYAAGAVFLVNQPLPNKGACKHYPHSYRLLRFPCCGYRYPCDLCHEQNSDGHEMKWATRMACGFCGTEQPVSSHCKACLKRLTTTASKPSGKNTSYWEGGQGQRDKKKLSKNDPKKFSDSKLKTHSKKAERVGQEGKKKREES
jgi:hypothetical protein